MKHLRKFEKYTNLRKKDQIIKESVLQVNDIYKVRTFIDIPQSLINAYVKKVKDTTGKNLRQFFGDVDIAEEVVKYINTNFLNVDQIPAGALMGDAQSQGETQTDSQAQPAQAQPAQAQAQPTQAQAQTQDQAQAQPVQAQPQAEDQPQVQVQAESQPQGQGEFEEVAEEGEEGEEEKEEGTEEGGEELPL
jgi:hypothetical protein